MNKMVKVDESQVSNGAEETLAASVPYVIRVELEGTVPIIFHRYNCDSVEAKSKAAKGSAAKKTDDIESYVYRNDKREICIPGRYVIGSIVNAAKYKQDPRSPRKSAMDLFKAGVVALTELASLGSQKWDYEDRQPVQVQRSRIARVRPAMKPGWKASFDLMVHLPEYIPPVLLRQVLDDAGRLVGIADFRPTYGRFVVRAWAPAIK